ncbi:type I restriction enzyme specificity protein [gamma proteobacterium BDW918]|uniref:Type I restriction modification DNA specificity domain-containing protein n=1 Tax=Zhongshania aliphaticivorans TaxID=1470434 RepID=A0A127M2C5_9GAMM|nr:restriction endonuclease subunit S [Zhongshania aliphaticivorans]AMO67383.1 hypothetical protein AZF00_03280 [Zhongshania aliphaticivorans]EIF42980.1 type I restriction enzyme specificity protein [gamma proteobacterium BDW918]
MSKTDGTINATPQSSHSREGGNLELPTGWRITSLGEICDINPKSKLEDEMSVGFMPMSGVPKHYNGRCDFETRQWKDVKKGFTQFKNGDTILAKITPCFENGKAAVIKNFPSGWGAGSTEYYVLRPIAEGINPQLLLATVKSKDFLNNGAVNMTGSVGHKRVPKDYVENYPIPLPPLAEQKVIADKLDELLAQVDTLKTRLDAIPAILKRFRQSVLAAAVSGKLTKEWRSSNRFSFDYKKLENEKTKLIQQRLIKKDLDFQEGDVEFDTPANWKALQLKSLAEKITDGEHKTPKRETAGRILLSARNVRDGHIDLRNIDYVGEEEYIKLRKRCDPDVGDILISCSGSVGRISLVDQSDAYVMVRSAALVKTLPKFSNNQYLMLCLQSPQLQKEIESKSKSTAQANLFLGPIKELLIPIPSPEEQTEIVRRVEQLFTYADQVEQQVKNAQARVNQLTQSILAKAFRGELTEQWRQDNPELISGDNSAAALLERIKAERAAATTSKKKAPARKAKA